LLSVVGFHLRLSVVIADVAVALPGLFFTCLRYLFDSLRGSIQ